MQQRRREEEAAAVAKAGLVAGGADEDKAKCPVPRPILNILVNRKEESKGTDDPIENRTTPRTSEERERRWIENQIAVFRESYGDIPDYGQAEAYLESILSLATSGVESRRVDEIYAGGVYVEPYGRILSVIQSVGAVLEEVPSTEAEKGGNANARRIASKLIDQDFCLSMLDKIALVNERKGRATSAGGVEKGETVANPVAVPYDAAARLAYDAKEENRSVPFDEFKAKYEDEIIAMVSAKKKQRDDDDKPIGNSSEAVVEVEIKEEKPRRRSRLAFWRSRDKEESATVAIEASATADVVDAPTADDADAPDDVPSSPSSDPPIVINPDDLGGVLLSAEEPTMTRQLNVLSNIVQRTLIFGGDQELLVLAETLDADKPAFLQRWYAGDDDDDDDDANDGDGESIPPEEETRPGVQYLNSLIQLLRDCYAKGVLREVAPALPLNAGYRNAYGRLTASLIELGSGYVKPNPSSSLSLAMTTTAATAKYLTSTAPPKSAREELGRFAKWESAVRKNRENPYPDDLVGTWNVQDVVGTQTIGTTEVSFKPRGELSVRPPMQGLRWRLDPGPTHLDTCTFQVLSEDGAILQYKGFVDRGSRLEARVSKRSVSMRGGVSFLMRDAEDVGGGAGDDYYDDIVPMNYKSGTTKFIMSRNKDGGSDGNGNSADFSSGSTTASAGLRGPLACPPVAEGEREILDGPNGSILVTKVAGSYYAVDATCPHLGLPMKKGKISLDDKQQPTLTCSFHNSCFELQTGKCTKWVTGALGSENDVIAGIMGGLGSEQKDIVAYTVSEETDGSLRVTSEIAEASKIAA